jgi:hypothetical protein
MSITTLLYARRISPHEESGRLARSDRASLYVPGTL